MPKKNKIYIRKKNKEIPIGTVREFGKEKMMYRDICGIKKWSPLYMYKESNKSNAAGYDSDKEFNL